MVLVKSVRKEKIELLNVFKISKSVVDNITKEYPNLHLSGYIYMNCLNVYNGYCILRTV